MKVILLDGSAKPIGNTSNILADFADELEREGIETEHIQLYAYDFTSCNDCRTCEVRGDGRCIDEADGFNDILDAMREADGIVLASPGYAGSASGRMRTFLERAALVLEKGDRGLRGKVGAAIAVSEHDGAESTYMQLVWWMLKSEMHVVGTCPMPIFHALGQYEDDTKAMKGLKRLAENMTELIMLKTGEL